MDVDAQKINYHRLDASSTSQYKPNFITSDKSSSPVQSQSSPIHQESHHRHHQGSSNTSSLPTPTLIADLQNKAQGPQCPIYPLLTQYLPNDIGLTHQHYPSDFLATSPLLLSPESNCDQTCSLLGQGKSIFRYSGIKSVFPSHRLLCTPMSIGPSENGKVFLHWKWPIVRQICLLAFFTCFAGILCILIGLLISSPLPPCNEEHKWFHGTIFYEIFPASFQDTDGDGYGDFKGIVRRLDYIQNLGVRAIRLNSVFSALDYPLEYEHIIDLRNVDPHLGRIRDFEHLVKECHKRGIRVVLDINPTVTSDQHTWALHWQRGIDGYQHFYASANRSKAPPEMEDNFGPPPEDWELTQRTFGGHYVVNWSNPSVRNEYRRTLNFWIQLGVDGFYMKHLEKMYVQSPEDAYVAIKEWRDELDRFHLWSPMRSRILMTSSAFAEYAFNNLPNSILSAFDLIDVPLYVRPNASESLAKQISNVEDSEWRLEFKSSWIIWHFGSSDTFRFASRVDSEQREAAFYVLAMLPGSISIFYGDEIGLTDSYDVITGNVYRGGQFSPMLWASDNTTGNFSMSMEPWLPLIPDHEIINVESQKNVLKRFVKLMKIRNKYLKGNGYAILNTGSAEVFALERNKFHNNPDSRTKLILVANFDHQSTNVATKFISSAKILATTSDKFGKHWSRLNITLKCGEAVVGEVSN